MSTISLPYEKQIRHFFVADAMASETTIQSFIDDAAVGEMQIFDQNGQAIDHTSGELKGDFYLVKKNQKGGISKTDLITPKDVTYLNGVKPVAKTGKTQTFTLASAPTAGAHYIVDLKVNYGNSEENFISFIADARGKAGDTATTLLTRLAKGLADNLAMSVNTSAKANAGDDVIIAGTSAKKNKYFTITVAGSVMTITEKDWILDDFRPGLRTHDQLMWNAEVMVPGNEDEADNVTKGGTAPVYAKGQGYQIVELERYLVGHRAEFETRDVTLGFGRTYDTDISAQYFVLDLKYFDVSRDDPKHSDKMLTIASTDAKVIDAIGFAVEAAMGKTEGDIWVELDAAQDGADNV
jgi:hypothetical protein